MHSQSSQHKNMQIEMSLSELTGRCTYELEHYLNNETHDDQYYLEIFHRAIVNHETDVWEIFQQYFSPLLKDWVRNHPQRNLACSFDLEENYVANTFSRVWQASMCNRLEFDTLVAAMRYLKLSLQGTILDTLRAYAQPRELPFPDPDSVTYSSEKSAIRDDYKSSDLWEIIKSMLHDERQRRLAYLLFHNGLKPREIVRYASVEFGDLQEIIRLRQNILEQLIRPGDKIH